MKGFIRKILFLFKNKYVITTIIFLVWMIVFDQNNFISQFELARKYNELKQNKKYYLDQIKKDTTDLHNLLTKPENLEEFARETYLMKRDNEDVFIIIKKDSSLNKEK